MILAGDVGGTKTALALLDRAGPSWTRVRSAVSPSHEFGSLEAVVRAFLGDQAPTIDAACFGVAGAVIDGRCVATNLPWEIDERRLAAEIPARRVRLINDLEAAGHGVLELPASDRLVIQAGQPRTGSMALIAAGTGLGEALLVWDGRHHHVVPSEGGHTDFGPRDERELRLLTYLQAAVGHVSYERVLSGPGLVNIYRFLRDTGAHAEPAWLRDRLAAGDPGATISELGLAGGHPLCVEALDLFVSIYGAEAGNLALKALAVGGVMVGGGIAPKIRPALLDGRFTAAFRDKGRFHELLAAMPIHLILNAEAPLLGAAKVARESLAGAS